MSWFAWLNVFDWVSSCDWFAAVSCWVPSCAWLFRVFAGFLDVFCHRQLFWRVWWASAIFVAVVAFYHFLLSLVAYARERQPLLLGVVASGVLGFGGLVSGFLSLAFGKGCFSEQSLFSRWLHTLYEW